MKLIVVCLFLSILALCASKKTGPKHKKYVVCNVPTKSLRKQQGILFELENADLNECTHVTVDRVTMKKIDSWDAPSENEHEEWTRTVEDYKELIDLWNTYPHLNFFMGCRHSASEYLEIATSPSERQDFIRKSHDFVVRNKLNGLNLAIDGLERDDISSKNFTQIALFIEALEETLSHSHLDLSVTIEYTKDLSIDKYNFTQLSQNVDFISFVQVQKLNNATKPTVDDVLRDHSVMGFNEKLDQIISSGVEPGKVVMGIASVGFVFTGVPLQSSDYDNATFESYKTYAEICALRSIADAEVYAINGSGPAVLKVEMADQIQTIVFENSRTIANEILLAMEQEIGGLQLNIAADDNLGLCKPDTDTFEDFQDVNNTVSATAYLNRSNSTLNLLRTIDAAIVVSLHEMQLPKCIRYSKRYFYLQIYFIAVMCFALILSWFSIPIGLRYLRIRIRYERLRQKFAKKAIDGRGGV